MVSLVSSVGYHWKQSFRGGGGERVENMGRLIACCEKYSRLSARKKTSGKVHDWRLIWCNYPTG